MKIKGIVVILFVLIQTLAYSQAFQFNHISGFEGLHAKSIIAISQDSYGFMWFGSETGLSKYDGYTITNYTHDLHDSCSISENYIFDILEDTIAGNLWIATAKGLDYYDSSKKYFSKNKFESNLDIEKVLKSVTTLFRDTEGTLWLGSGCGVVCINNANEIKLFLESDHENAGYENYTYAIEHWKDNLYFILKQNGLFVLNKDDASCKKILDGSFISVLKDSRNNFWFGTGKCGLWYLPNDNEDIVQYEPNNVYHNDGVIKEIVEDGLGRIWISVRDKGIEIIDPQNQEQHYISYSMHNQMGLQSNSGQSMFVDKHDNVWVGTSDAGVSFYDHNKKAFTNYQFNYSAGGLKNNNVRSMYQDSDGDIWIGSKSGGYLSRFDKKNGAFKHFENNPNNPNSLNDDYVFCITEDRPGYLWIGTFRGGLNLLDKESGKFTHYMHDPKLPNSVSENSVYTLCKDSKGQLWVGTDFSGLDVFDSKMEKRNFTQNVNDSRSISGNRIRYVYEDNSQSIWVGTLNGLNLYHEKSRDFKRYVHNENDSSSISHNSIRCIYEDSKERLWIGTYGGGLNLMNRKNETFVAYTQKDGLANDIILGIVEDNEGDLWMSTLNGVSKFVLSDNDDDIPMPNFKNYDEKDGLRMQKFNLNSFLKTTDGEILFGGSNGFTVFNPKAIDDNPIKPKVCFTDFKLFNKSVKIGVEGSPLKQDINHTHQLTLKHNQSIFSISYVAINYSSTEKNQYAFIMEGLEDEWNYVDTRREATYTNLKPGTYTFRVKASNNDGLWNKDGASIQIKILPHPLLTWWAYSFYCVVVLLVIGYLRLRSLKVIEAQKEHEIDQAKLKFFINISHEFRTPLTLILNPINKIMSAGYPPELENSVQNIHRNTHQLLRLVNQLLDDRKSELGKLALKAVQLDIVKFTQQSVLLFQELASAKNIKMKYISEPSEIKVWLDPEKYEKIINNLLSNAIKYTNHNDKVSISLSIVDLVSHAKIARVFKTRQKHLSYVKIKVTDTGIGIKQEHIHKIFERFQSVNEAGTGTGIGLNYTKGLIELHKGKIEVESEYGIGSSFCVYLPLGKNHLNDEQLSKAKFTLNEFSYNVSDIESVKYEIGASNTAHEDNGAEEELEDKEALKKKMVLIVEDNRNLRTQIKLELQNKFTIKEAIDGLDGLEKTEKYFPDLIISDVMMPKMDGVEFCKKIKSDINTSHIPIVLLTAKSLSENKVQGFKIGADDYMVKPFNMEVLIARINNILQSRKILKEKYQSTNSILPASEFTQNNKDEEFLDNITKIVIDNISDHEFTFKELREQVGLSNSSFYRKITELTNMSPSHFLRHVRINYASELLLKNDLTIKEICYRSGFNSPSHFSRTFRTVLKKSPLEYQQENIKK
jgi:signal transduction histidine kinase/ligand-binding sensor domain-containing protein/DNA-binding response OmpR family regulator